jgi:hypothetical protein
VRAAIAEAGRPLTLGEIVRALSAASVPHGPLRVYHEIKVAVRCRVYREIVKAAVWCHPGMFSKVLVGPSWSPAFDLAEAEAAPTP